VREACRHAENGCLAFRKRYDSEIHDRRLDIDHGQAPSVVAHRETGTIEAAGDAIANEDMIAFIRFLLSLRRERERLGLSLADVAKLAGIDKAALGRLENGLQVNPTVNTLARYVRALGKSLKWGIADPE
jgi:DNA-binding XRE family transcriptional regulator